MILRVVCTLAGTWVLFSSWVYTAPPEHGGDDWLSPSGVRGKVAWERSGCVSCHQIYGLGGFMGPDLTDVMERAGPNYLSTMVRLGSQWMPPQDLSDAEIVDLAQYLTEVGRSGSWPPRGWPPPWFSAP